VVLILHHPHHGHVSPVQGRVDFVDPDHSTKQACSRHIDQSGLKHGLRWKGLRDSSRPSIEDFATPAVTTFLETRHRYERKRDEKNASLLSSKGIPKTPVKVLGKLRAYGSHTTDGLI